MKDRCIQAVAKALGRDITQAEAKNIEERIVKNLRFVAKDDPAAFSAMPPAQRLQMAAQAAAKELVEEAHLKLLRAQLTVQAHDRIQNQVNDLKAGGIDGMDAVERQLVFKADGKSKGLSAESLINATKADAVRRLIDTFEAVNPKFWGLFESKEGVVELTRAMFGEKVQTKEAEAGANAWRDVTESLRQRFNALGGKVKYLEDWSLPFHHSMQKVAAAGEKAWVDFVYPMLKREKYLNADGTRMNDAQVMEFLKSAYDTISTGGVNQMTPGDPKTAGMMANRRAYHREVHMKDADSYLKYQEQFGEKSLWGVITGHIDNLSREIGMMEMFGPNPDATFKLFLDKEYQSAVMSSRAKRLAHDYNYRYMSGLYDFMVGNTQPVASEWLSKKMDTLRNWMISTKLGSAAITAITDEATVHLTANVNKLPQIQLIQNELAAFNLANRTEEHLAHRAGLALDTMLNHLNRWGQDNLGPTFSSKMSNTVMRASGLEALDGARRRAFGVTMMSSLGEIAGKYAKLADIDPHDYRILMSKGITETDFSIWKAAELEKWGAGNGVLTPESIMRIPSDVIEQVAGDRVAVIKADKQAKIEAINKMEAMTPEERAQSIANWSRVFDEQVAAAPDQLRMDAIKRLLGVTLEETDMAVIRPGMKDRFSTGGQFIRGSVTGELMRSFFLFKGFPLAMISRHWMRGMGMETVGGKAAYIASLVVATTVLGVVSQTVNDVLQGKDPRAYLGGDPGKLAKNWTAAMLKGGALGIYGDFLFSRETQGSRVGPMAALLGPIAGTIEDAYNLTVGNAIDASHGKDAHFGADAIRFVKSNTPGANLWYLKAALDHMIFHQLQEYFSPGYLGKMQQRARTEFDQTYFWRPGAGVDEMRAPDLGRVMGE